MKSLKFLLVIIIISQVFLSCEETENKSKITEEKPASLDHAQNELFHVSEGAYRPEMIYVEGGEFSMGDNSIKTNIPHPVVLSSFYISKNMVTISELKEFLDDIGLEFSWDWDDGDGYGPFNKMVPTDDCPAQGLNWYYAVIFCNWASKKDNLEPCYEIDKLPNSWNDKISVNWKKESNGYRLPTDAEWEYAAQGGKSSKGFIYPGSNDPDDVGRARDDVNSSYPIGQFLPNELGIYDMGGNADEWCWDWYDRSMYKWLPTKDPSVDKSEDVKEKVPPGYDLKVIRGGSWYFGIIPISERSSYRPENISITGIRLVRNAN